MTQAPTAKPQIMEGGYDGEPQRGTQGSMAQPKQPCRCVRLCENDRGHGDDLGERVGFAKNAGPEISHANRVVKQGSHDQDSQIATEHEHSNPQRHQPDVRQHEEQRAKQEFVRNGVQICAQLCALTEYSRQESIQTVTDTSHDQQNQSAMITAVQNGQHEKWNKGQPQQRQLIGQGSELLNHAVVSLPLPS